MTQSTKKVTRRDAIKLLGAAAGAAMLANVPAKWSKPSLMSGVLPAHAQTSCISLTIEFLDPEVSAGPIEEVEPQPVPDFFLDEPVFTVGWYCQAGCLAFWVEGNGTVRVTTLTNQFDVTVPYGQTGYQIVLVNLGTGEYALNGNGTAGACEWPLLPNSSAPRNNAWNR